MSREEMLDTRYGEFIDLVSCLLIFEGRLIEKAKEEPLTYDEAISLR